MADLKEEVIQVVRSLLLTSKNGTTINKLNVDYKTLEDRNVPYQLMGFSSLEAFLRQIPSLRVTRRGSEVWVEAIPTRESAHIARLVAGQRQSSSRRRPQRSRQMPARRPHAMSRSHDANHSRFRSSNSTGSAYRSSFNFGASGSHSRPSTQQHGGRPPPPLMGYPTPMTPPTTPRYTSSATTQMASPSKRMIDRNIQPQQHLDYERKSRAAAVSGGPSSASNFETTTPRETFPTARNQPSPRQEPPPLMPTVRNQPSPRQEPPPLMPIVRNQQSPRQELSPSTPTTPISVADSWPSSGPVPMSPGPLHVVHSAHVDQTVKPSPSRTVQLSARKALSDRLILQLDNLANTGSANVNGGIRVTIANNPATVSPSPPVETPITPTTPSDDPRDELRQLLRHLNLSEPEYKITPVVGKKGVVSGFYGLVLIGSSKFSSYPEDARTEKDAEILAARQAYAELVKQRGSKFSLRQTFDRNLIKDRILSIVDEHNGGVFTHKISDYYRQRYNENLPDDWPQDVAKWMEVETNQGVDKSIILRRRSSCNDQLPRQPTMKTDKVLLNPIGRVEPGKLKLPKEDFWVVHVPTVISTTEIWVRLVGEDYSDLFEQLAADMSVHYASFDTTITETIEVDGYYALKEGENWHRVRVIEIDDATATADVFFIDIGVEDTVTTKSLRTLDKKFVTLDAQATQVTLAYLEDFSECPSIVPRIEQTLLDGTFWAEVLSRDTTEDGASCTTVVFHDTNGPCDLNLNDFISKRITEQLITNVPQLEIEGRVTEVHVSHVEANGDVFIQVKSEVMRLLVKMLNKLTQNGITADELKRSEITTIDRAKVYFAKCSKTGNWYRARIIDDNKVTNFIKMFLIDFGRIMNVEKRFVIDLAVLSQFLAEFPAQAMKVRLHDIDTSMFDEKIVKRLIGIAPPSDLLILKVVRPSYRGSPPTVELFKRTQPDNVLGSINNTLVFENELSKTNGDGNNNVRPRKRLERMNSRQSGDVDDVAKVLKPPPIAGIGEYFDVRVTMAANPGNFTVQPHAMTNALRTMMADLQKACLTHVGPKVSLESIREGKLYAANHVDGHWYRVCVSNVINENMVTVYFCDYGDVTVITLNKLQKLQKQFLDLPYQAIKAKLVGIQPTNKDWAVEDTIRFQNLVVEKEFVSVVVESAPDKHSPGETVLGLKLIDVSTPEDINIGKLLVDEGRATFTD